MLPLGVVTCRSNRAEVLRHTEDLTHERSTVSIVAAIAAPPPELARLVVVVQVQASAARALGGGRSAAALADSAWGRLRMGRPELPQERVQLGRAPLAAAGHAVAALESLA